MFEEQIVYKKLFTFIKQIIPQLNIVFMRKKSFREHYL